MAITRQKKEQILQDLEAKLSKASAIYFAKNSGLSVKQSASLRRKLHEQGIDFVVAKKTLLKLAAKHLNMPELSDDSMEGPIGTAFGYDDVVTPAKVIKTLSKEFTDEKGEKLTLTGGMIDGRVLSKAEAMQIASLPGREQLLAQLVGTMKAPIQGFYGVLHGVMSGFVRTLDAVRANKSE